MRPEQREQIQKQIEAYERQQRTQTVEVSLGNETLRIEVDPFVANPEIMNSGIQVVEFLKERPDLVRDKIVTDMGTGSGIIGISAAKLGARKAFMPDVDARAVANASRNIRSFGLDGTCETFESDLFENYGDRLPSDIQIFNHPFFSGKPVEDKPWTRMMLGGTELIERYFKTAPRYSHSNTKYILPWLTLASNEEGALDNDPDKRAKNFGFRVTDVAEQAPVQQGIQQNVFKIYTLIKE